MSCCCNKMGRSTAMQKAKMMGTYQHQVIQIASPSPPYLPIFPLGCLSLGLLLLFMPIHPSGLPAETKTSSAKMKGRGNPSTQVELPGARLCLWIPWSRKSTLIVCFWSWGGLVYQMCLCSISQAMLLRAVKTILSTPQDMPKAGIRDYTGGKGLLFIQKVWISSSFAQMQLW